MDRGNMAEENTNKTTQRAIDEWVNAVNRLGLARTELKRADVEAENLKNALGKLLSPKDATIGEKFSIWSRKDGIEMLLVVEKTDFNTFNVNWRK